MKIKTHGASALFAITSLLIAPTTLAEIPETGIGYIDGNTFQDKEVVYEKRDGLAIFEGDIILGTVEELEATTSGAGMSIQSIVRPGREYRWPDNTVPYQFADDFPSEYLTEYQQRFSEAAQHYSQHTNIQIVERTASNAHLYPDYVEVFSGGENCASGVGRYGGRQSIRVSVYEEYNLLGCSTGTIIHEFGHTLGLWHEQSREDRDAYVTIHWENIQEGYESNFNQHISDGDDIGPYDYNSVMHYSAKAFSNNGQQTITPLDPNATIGSRSGLSDGDIAALNSLYPPLEICEGLDAPANLTFSNVGSSGFTVNWDPSAGADLYLVETISEGNFRTWLATEDTSYDLSGFSADTWVGVNIQAQKNGCGITDQPISVQKTAACQGAPATPDSVSYTNVTSTSFDLQWGAVAGADYYTVETGSNGNFETYTTQNTEIQLDGFEPGALLAFNIKAHSNSCGSSTEGYVEVITLSQGGSFEENDLSAGWFAWNRFDQNIPSGMSTLTVTLEGGSGNASLYVRQGQAPSTSSYDCRSRTSGNGETCVINNPGAGDWHIGVYSGWSSVSGANLTVEWRP